MVKRFLVLFTLSLLLCLLILSCGGEGKRKLFNLRKSYPPSLIRNHLLFSDLSNEYSFPIWFHDSLVELNKISKVTRLIYPKRLTEASRGDSILNVPSETIEYFFRTDGTIENIKRSFYFDDRKISEFDFLYPKPPNKHGFAQVKVVKNNLSKAKSTTSETANFTEVNFKLYDEKKVENQFIEFENRNTGDFLYVIPKKEFWGALNIDRYIRPNPNDVLILGDLGAPKKIYQVENKVNETNVVEYSYKKGSIKTIQTNNYPFHTTRFFTYDKRGYCIGYIDSTFSDNSFLTRTISNFENNMSFSPTKIYHRKENSENKLTLINYEEFVYEYRK
jgi:hypothetical protein